MASVSIKEVLDFLSKDKKNLEFATNLLFVNKNLERSRSYFSNMSKYTLFN